MARIKVKHPSPSENSKRSLLNILAQQDIYVTKIEQVRDGFSVISSSERETDALFETTCLEHLKNEAYTPILPPEQKSKRTILLFGVDDFIRSHTEEEIKLEIYRVNDYAVGYIDSIYKFPNNAILKISFTQNLPAQKSKDNGLKMYNMRIPHHQIKEEDYTPITSCMRCYAVEDHYTNQCPKPKEYTICSECGSVEHMWYDCRSSTKTCINCSGAHRTLAYKCPVRKKARDKAKEEKKAAGSKTYSAAASAQPLATSQNLVTPEAANKILTCLLQAHLMNVSDPGSFEEELNKWLTFNNLPTVRAPSNPDSHKLLHPAHLHPQTLAQSPASEEEDDNDSDEQEDDEITKEETNEMRRPPSTTPSRHPSPQTNKSKNKSLTKHTSTTRDHSNAQEHPTQTHCSTRHSPSPPPNARGRIPGKPRQTRRKH